MAAAAEIILHHYDASPFSEKARLMLGLKSLAWRSVVTPNMAPKPDLVPLTGGYRRAPVMQVGADVFCDSQLILAEIERRVPSPAVARGMDRAVNLWADRPFFQTTVPIIFGELGDKVPRAFIEDREKLSGRAFDVAAMKASSTPLRGQWRAQAAWIESALAASAGPFLGGERPSLADVSAYMNVWFLAGATPAVAENLLAGFERVRRWRESLAAVGHGVRAEMTGAEALAVARAADPGHFTENDPADPIAALRGEKITVRADDYGRDEVAGVLVAANAERLVVQREAGDLGRIHVHFPRVGYMAAPA